MSEIVFECPCLASGCNDRENRKWHHEDCPFTSKYYLSDTGVLRCDCCGKKFNFVSREWKGPCCNHDYKKSDLQRAMAVFSKLASEKNIPDNFIRKLLMSLIEQFNTKK